MRPQRNTQQGRRATHDDGFMLITGIVLIFLVLLVLSVAAPRVAKQIQHDREMESEHRAREYTRAIRVYYQKFHHYPGSVEQLEKTNNQRFLRQRYTDPLTGKDDWRIIHVGENQTKVKGFFGEDLPGLQAGLGSAAGMASPTGGQTVGGSGSAFSNGGPGGSGSGFGGNGGAFGGSGNSPGGIGSTPSAGGSGSGSGTGSTGVSSQNATDATGGGGGMIMGIGSSKTGDAMLVVNEQTTYDTWEFLYDPRIEQLYAKATLIGGVSSGSPGSGGLGTVTPSLPTNGNGLTPTTPIGPTTPRGP